MKNSMIRIRNKKGLTLMEMIIAIGLLGVISITVLASLNYGVTNIGRTGRTREQMNINRSEIAQRTFDNDYESDRVTEVGNTVTVTIQVGTGITRDIEGVMAYTGEGKTKIETFVPTGGE